MRQTGTRTQATGQEGAALIFGLVFLLITTVLTVASMRGSNLQERMTSNLNHQTISFATAERGASELTKLLTSEHFWTSGPGSEFRMETSPPANAETDNDNGYSMSVASSVDSPSARDVTELLQLPPSHGDNGTRHFVESANWNVQTGQLTVLVTGESMIADQIAGRSTIRITVSQELDERTPPVLEQGLIADGNIELDAPITLRGTAHTNADLITNGYKIAFDDSVAFPIGLSAAGTISGSQDCLDDEENCVPPENATSGVDAIRIPSALEAIACLVDEPSLANGFEHWDASADRTFYAYCEWILEERSFRITRGDTREIVHPEEIIVLPDCTLDLLTTDAGQYAHIDLLGEVYFCDGDVHAGGNPLRNGTILATGDIVIGGTAPTGGTDEIDTAFLAGGRIILQGPNALSGIFWADTGISHTGGGTVSGRLMAGGGHPANEDGPGGGSAIRLGSVLTFKQVDQLGRFTPRKETVSAGRITGWAHIN